MCQSVVYTVFDLYAVVAVSVKILMCVCGFPVECGDECVVGAW